MKDKVKESRFAKDSDELRKEVEFLASLKDARRIQRWKAYWDKTGPGWMLSAMTIGGGTAMASLFAGAFYQYRLLWLQPMIMIIGLVMLSALSYQTLVTGERPFQAMKKYVHPAFAWTWALATLLSTMIWHFSMYSLASGMSKDILRAVLNNDGWGSTYPKLTMVIIGLVLLGIAILVVWNYNRGWKGVRRFEKALKIIVWFIIFCFLFIVIERTIASKVRWSEVFKGFIPSYLPTDRRGVTLIMGAFSATVGINMTFLFGYSYLKRGWGHAHRGLAVFDMFTGMLIPFSIATALMIIATGATIYEPATFADGNTMISPIDIAQMLQEAGLPMLLSRVIFGLGIVAMALNAIILHMIVCGFVITEVFNIAPGSLGEKMAALIPVPGIIGVIYWEEIGPWIAMPTGAVAGLLLPVAYIGFFILNNNSSYLGKYRPRGWKALIWNAAMILAITISIASIAYYIFGMTKP